MVKYLIGAGADVDVKAKNGATAFTLATTIDDADTEMVRLVASKQSLSAVGRGGGGGAAAATKNVSRNSSSIAWMTPAKIVAKAKTAEKHQPQQLTMTKEQFSLESDPAAQRGVVIITSCEEQAEAYFNQEAKNANGSLKHWWNRMSNR